MHVFIIKSNRNLKKHISFDIICNKCRLKVFVLLGLGVSHVCINDTVNNSIMTPLLYIRRLD